MENEMNMQAIPDPETLSRSNVQNIAPLQEVFCSLKGKTALVTGGASGLGYTVVNRLAEAGANVVIASRNQERGERAIAEFRERGYAVSWVRTDVTKVSDCANAVDFAVKNYGGLDILVADAAVWDNYSYLDVPENVFDKVVDTDLKGAYFIGQAAARHMVANKVKGKIVFVSSAAHLGEGPSGIVMNTFYQAAKAGVVGMTRGIACELKQYGISVNCVAEYAESSQHTSGTPLAMNPDMVALAVYAMCTPMSDFMCGETVNVNGGALMNFQKKPFSYTVEGCIPGPQK